jgi:hypothetical protein
VIIDFKGQDAACSNQDCRGGAHRAPRSRSCDRRRKRGQRVDAELLTLRRGFHSRLIGLPQAQAAERKVPGAAPAQTVPDRVIDVYVVERDNDTDPAVGSPVKDPADMIAGPVDRRPGARPTPAASPAPAPPPGLAAAPTARCTIKVTSNKVLLAARRGKPKRGAPAPKPGTSR